jgi:hypothetical protein
MKILPHTLTAALMLLAAAAGATAMPTPPSDNLLHPTPPPWYETWKAGYGCSLTKTGGGETTVLRQTLPAGFTSGNHSWQLRVPVQPGETYTFTVQYQLENVGAAMAQFHFADAGGKLMDYRKYRLSTQTLSGTESAWKSLTYTFTAPADVSSVMIALRLNSPGTVYWNTPTLETVSPASDNS